MRQAGWPRLAWWSIAALTVIADQLSKWAAQVWLAPARSLPLIPGLLHLTYVRNTGAAFGLFRGYSSVFILLAVLVAGWVSWELARRRHPPLGRLGLALILGGAVGNVIDRLRIGSVIDFIDVRVWPVFNLADSAITVGVVLLVWMSFRPSSSAS